MAQILLGTTSDVGAEFLAELLGPPVELGWRQCRRLTRWKQRVCSLNGPHGCQAIIRLSLAPTLRHNLCQELVHVVKKLLKIFALVLISEKRRLFRGLTNSFILSSTQTEDPLMFNLRLALLFVLCDLKIDSHFVVSVASSK